MASTQSTNVQNGYEFKVKWALKKLVRRLYGLSVPHHNHWKEAVEEW